MSQGHPAIQGGFQKFYVIFSYVPFLCSLIWIEKDHKYIAKLIVSGNHFVIISARMEVFDSRAKKAHKHKEKYPETSPVRAPPQKFFIWGFFSWNIKEKRPPP